MTPSQSVSNYDQTRLSRGVLETVLDLWIEFKKEHNVPIRGKSMVPILKDGDIAKVVHDIRDLKPGDIVIFRKGWYLIAHRVLLQYQDESGRRFYVTQGDKSRRPDSPVEENEIIGRVVGVVREGRYLLVDCRQQKWYRKLTDINLYLKLRFRRWMWIFHLLKVGVV